MYNPQLETFVRVADAGSFNKAADDAFITPTAVIKQINCEQSRNVLTVIGKWSCVHPMLKELPVAWDHAPPPARAVAYAGPVPGRGAVCGITDAAHCSKIPMRSRLAPEPHNMVQINGR